MKRILVLTLLVFSFLLFSVQTYAVSSIKIKITMLNYYAKLDKSTLSVEQKIGKLDKISAKLDIIKEKKWEKLSEDSQSVIEMIESSISKKTEYYKEILASQEEELDLSFLFEDEDLDSIDIKEKVYPIYGFSFSNSNAKLNWKSVKGATKYELDFNTYPNKTTGGYFSDSSETNSYNFPSFVEHGKYKIYILAYGDNDNVIAKASIVVDYRAVVGGSKDDDKDGNSEEIGSIRRFKLDNEDGRLEWKRVDGADVYELSFDTYPKKTTGGYYLGSTESNRFDFPSFFEHGKYKVYVSAYKGEAGNDNLIAKSDLVIDYKQFVVKDTSGVTPEIKDIRFSDSRLSWNYTQRAARYKVNFKDIFEGREYNKETTSNYVTIGSDITGGLYTVTITGYNSDNELFVSAKSSIVVRDENNPEIKNPRYEDGKVMWDNVSGATRFTVVFKDLFGFGDTPKEYTKETTGNYVEVGDDIPPSFYGVTITAFNQESGPFAATYIGVPVKEKDAPEIKNARQEDGKVMWDNVSGATRFTVVFKDLFGFGDTPKEYTKETTGNYVEIGDDIPVGVYGVTITGYDSSNFPFVGVYIGITIKDESIPEITNEKFSDGLLTWDKVPGATSYSVEFLDLFAEGNQLRSYYEQMVDNHYSVSKEVPKGVYGVTITARNDTDGPFTSKYFGVSIPNDYYIRIPVLNLDKAIFEWNKVEGVDSYQVIIMDQDSIDTLHTGTTGPNEYKFPETMNFGKYNVVINGLSDGKIIAKGIFTLDYLEKSPDLHYFD